MTLPDLSEKAQDCYKALLELHALHQSPHGYDPDDISFHRRTMWDSDEWEQACYELVDNGLAWSNDNPDHGSPWLSLYMAKPQAQEGGAK